MNNILEINIERTNVILGAPLAVAAFLIGSFDVMLQAVLALIVIDFVTGILKAIYNKELDSQTMYKGAIKKIGLLFVISVANIIDNSLDLQGVIRNMAIGYYIANEGISIVENWGGLNLPLPQKLIDVLKQLKEKDEDLK